MADSVAKSLEPGWLVEQIVTSLKTANLDWNDTPSWTRALQNGLRTLLEVAGSNVTDVLYSDSKNDNHEFLLDIVVWDRTDGEGVSVAVESEWLQSVHAVVEDFWKLMVVKAPVKIMIFATNRNASVFTQQAAQDGLKRCLELYRDHIAGERYIFIDFAQAPKGQARWITIPANGKLAAIPEPTYVALA